MARNINSELISLYFSDIGEQQYLTHPEEIEIFTNVERDRIVIANIVEQIFGNKVSTSMGLAFLEKIPHKNNYAYGIAEDYSIPISKIMELSAQAIMANNSILNNRDTIITKNLKLVITHAKKYKNLSKSMELIDLIQEGNLGLMEAFDRFEVQRGYRFSTYAVWWIRHTIGKSLSDKDSLIRIPTHVYQLISKLNKYEGEFYREHNRKSTHADLVREMGIEFANIMQLRDALNQIYPFDSPSKTLSEKSIEATIGTSYDFSSELDKIEIDEYIEKRFNHIFSCLSELEKKIIELRFNIKDKKKVYSMYEIGDMLNIPAPRVIHIEAMAIMKIREEYKPPKVKDLIELLRKKYGKENE